MAGDRERCLEAGANDYLSKPIGLRRLAEMIQEHLGVGEKTPLSVGLVGRVEPPL
jgi:CheY-like chemotaxis protein